MGRPAYQDGHVRLVARAAAAWDAQNESKVGIRMLLEKENEMVRRMCVLIALSGIIALSAQAQTFTTLYSFNGVDGTEPYASLIQGTDGNLYGTTYLGGAGGLGTIFKITPSGKLTTLYSFCTQVGCHDGSGPAAPLVQGLSGDFVRNHYGGF